MSKDKLKICHIITRMIVGGAQENTLLTILGQLELGHEVTLFTGPSLGPEGKLLERQKSLPNFEIVETPNLVRELSPKKDLAAYRELKAYLSTGKFDVAHTHSSKAGIVGRAAATAAGVPYVVHTVHGQAFHAYEKAWKNWIYRHAERWAARRCHKIYAVAQAMVDQCVAAGVAPADKYKVVYSGMDLTPFLNGVRDLAQRERLNIPLRGPVIGAVARLFPLKGYEYFVPAAALIAKERPDVTFLVVGDGLMRAELEAQVAALGLTDNFVFAGLVPPEEVPPLIAQMDIMAHLSLREGLPRVVVQALASGKPALGFRLDGTPEVIRDGQTGFCVAPEDVEAVAEAALKLLGDPAELERMGRNGRELVRERFDWRRMATILTEDYLQGLR